jgi:mono/diheme cytochrome c family protein
MPVLRQTALLGMLLLINALPGQARAQIIFTQEQVAGGRAIYREICQTCHGATLADGQFGTPLRGNFFRNKWAGMSLGELMQFMYEKMPPDNLESLSGEEIARLLAYIFSRNDMTAGDTPLSDDIQGQMETRLPW